MRNNQKDINRSNLLYSNEKKKLREVLEDEGYHGLALQQINYFVDR